MLRKGSQLCSTDRRHVLNAYIYRMTHESTAARPELTASMQDGGYAMPLISDEAWLANTTFNCKNDGTLDMRVKFCSHDHRCRV